MRNLYVPGTLFFVDPSVDIADYYHLISLS